MGPENGEAPTGADPLLNVIEQSKANLAAEDDRPLRRGRGRPPGRRSEEPRAEATAPESPPPAPMPEIELKPYLKIILEAPFRATARKRNFPGYALELEEADGLAAMWDEGLKPFAGIIVNSKWGALTMCAVSTALIIVGKETSYAGFLEEKRIEAQKTQHDAGNTAISSGIPATTPAPVPNAISATIGKPPRDPFRDVTSPHPPQGDAFFPRP